MFKHLLAKHDIFMYEAATMPCQQLKADVDRIAFVLQQTETVDGGAVDRREVGVVGFVARIGGLAKLFGRVGMKHADFDPPCDEGTLDWAVVAPRPLNDGDLVLDAVLCQGIADALQRRLEGNSVVLDAGRFHENSTVEIGDHDLRSPLGAIDADKGKILGADRSDTWMNHALWLVHRVRSGLTSRLVFRRHWTKTSRKRVGTEPTHHSGNLSSMHRSRNFTPQMLLGILNPDLRHTSRLWAPRTSTP